MSTATNVAEKDAVATFPDLLDPPAAAYSRASRRSSGEPIDDLPPPL